VRYQPTDGDERAYQLGRSAGDGSLDDAAAAFAALDDAALRWAFLRGCFDTSGSIAGPPGAMSQPTCSLTGAAGLLDVLHQFCDVPALRRPERLLWTGSNALDLLGRLYDVSGPAAASKRALYRAWRTWVPGLSGPGDADLAGRFRWKRVLGDAVPPAKRRASDSGYDLTLIGESERHGPVRFYRTGIVIQPAFGWYFDLVPRSSISRTGHILANSVGVIDRGYVGEILVPLIKLDDRAPDLQLPARVVQIIPRPIVDIDLIEVTDLDETARGGGGFGSTG